ncbi:MAG: hypothetical protein BJ554DRAFT_3872, partial [Olpidium bornovanus]
PPLSYSSSSTSSCSSDSGERRPGGGGGRDKGEGQGEPAGRCRNPGAKGTSGDRRNVPRAPATRGRTINRANRESDDDDDDSAPLASRVSSLAIKSAELQAITDVYVENIAFFDHRLALAHLKGVLHQRGIDLDLFRAEVLCKAARRHSGAEAAAAAAAAGRQKARKLESLLSMKWAEAAAAAAPPPAVRDRVEAEAGRTIGTQCLRGLHVNRRNRDRLPLSQLSGVGLFTGTFGGPQLPPRPQRRASCPGRILHP